MENPFDSVFETVPVKKTKISKKKYKLDELLELFPEESKNTVQLKKDIAGQLEEAMNGEKPNETFCLTQMFVNKFFYGVEYESEEKINKIIEMIPEFEMFKTI
jgi:hypothetical protein